MAGSEFVYLYYSPDSAVSHKRVELYQRLHAALANLDYEKVEQVWCAWELWAEETGLNN